MKFLFFIILALIQDFGRALPIGEQINITRNMCFHTTGLSVENREKIQQFEYPDTQETYRYMRCVFENLELWSEAFGIRGERIGEILEGQMNAPMVLEVIKMCNESSKTEDTDKWLYNTVDCITKRNITGVLDNTSEDI